MLYFEVTGDEYSSSDFTTKKKPDPGPNLMIIRDIAGPKESKNKPGTHYFYVILESCNNGGQMMIPLKCDSQGELDRSDSDGWKGQGKWENIASALGYTAGKVNIDEIPGSVIMADVEMRNGYASIRGYGGLWTPSEDERDRAAQYDLEKGE